MKLDLPCVLRLKFGETGGCILNETLGEVCGYIPIEGSVLRGGDILLTRPNATLDISNGARNMPHVNMALVRGLGEAAH